MGRWAGKPASRMAADIAQRCRPAASYGTRPVRRPGPAARGRGGSKSAVGLYRRSGRVKEKRDTLTPRYGASTPGTRMARYWARVSDEAALAAARTAGLGSLVHCCTSRAAASWSPRLGVLYFI